MLWRAAALAGLLLVPAAPGLAQPADAALPEYLEGAPDQRAAMRAARELFEHRLESIAFRRARVRERYHQEFIACRTDKECRDQALLRLVEAYVELKQDHDTAVEALKEDLWAIRYYFSDGIRPEPPPGGVVARGSRTPSLEDLLAEPLPGGLPEEEAPGGLSGGVPGHAPPPTSGDLLPTPAQ